MSPGAPRRRSTWRGFRPGDQWTLALVLALSAVGFGLMIGSRETFDATVLLAPLMLGGMLLTPRNVERVVAVVFVGLALDAALEVGSESSFRRWVSVALVALMCLVVAAVSRRRAALGVTGVRSDAMLLDLQDRLRRQGHLPALPRGWHTDVATLSAGGTSFAGDFVVAHLDAAGRHLSLVLVDVSGKGVQAGTRSLLLSGAFGGLLGAVPAGRFLPAANDFLVRQQWQDDFATAVHVVVDLSTGSYEVRSAGHPPVVQFVAGSGRWLVHEGIDGPVLGVVPDPHFEMRTGHLATGDALLLYTDGLVERSRRDINLGIDRLVGEGERLVRGGLRTAAAPLVAKLGTAGDDCALIVLERVPSPRHPRGDAAG